MGNLWRPQIRMARPYRHPSESIFISLGSGWRSPRENRRIRSKSQGFFEAPADRNATSSGIPEHVVTVIRRRVCLNRLTSICPSLVKKQLLQIGDVEKNEIRFMFCPRGWLSSRSYMQQIFKKFEALIV